MKLTRLLILLPFALLSACSSPIEEKPPMEGTWRLISGTTITKGDSVTIDYTKETSMIKIINASHFAFLKHAVDSPKDSSNHFDAGGGSYTLKGNVYTEHLDYYSNRSWEGNTFPFTIRFSGDTLIQKGIEKVAGTGVDHEIIERYVRVK